MNLVSFTKQRMPACAAVLAAVGCLLFATGCSRARPPEEAEVVPRKGGLPPREAAARMVTAPGFSLKLFASEPEIRQPVAMNWDDRGRMWVVEYIQYPDPAGLKALEWDRYFRTRYDRVPEPPPRGPRGADRIRILEDSDGDGRADRFTTFVDGLNLASGVAVGYGGVYVAQTPYLLFYPDRNQDDEPDGPPEVLLSGFGMEDAHAVVNSLTWGPDGWLYGAQGSTVTAHIRGHTFQQGIWRFHPSTREFELFAEGGGNTWSFDWDEGGQLLCGTNWGSYALLHMVQGGYYIKTFEKHGPLSNPYAFGYFGHAEHRGPFKGGHVTIGGLTYQADAFPPGFRGKHMAANILSNAIYWYDIEPVGSTFATRFGGELLNANDEWFRPVDLTTGPDGALYIADWYDVRATHNNTREDTWDKGSGRIYRLDHGDGHRAPRIRLSRQSSHELVQWLEHPNEWFHREARRILAERRDASIIPGLKAMLADGSSGHLALEHLWTLYVTGGFDETLGRGLLRHPDDSVRMWTIRFLGDAARPLEEGTLELLNDLAVHDPSPHVRSQLASTARRLPARQAVRILEGLIGRDEDDRDPHIPLLLWWGAEKHIDEQREAIIGLLAAPKSWEKALVRNHLAERTARRLASRGSEEDLAACVKLLRSSAASRSESAVLAGLDLGLAGKPVGNPSPPLEELLSALWERGNPGPELVRVRARFGSEAARRKVRELAGNAGKKTEDRVPMIDLLGQLGGTENLEALENIFARNNPTPVAAEALKALARFSDPKVARFLIRRLPSLDKDMRTRSLDVLASRKDWAVLLLRHLGGSLRREPAAFVQKLLQHDDPELHAIVEKNWGKVHASAAAKSEMIRNIAGIIGPVDLFSRPGRTYDKERGRKLFEERCAKCHTLFGKGGSTGPDLTGLERRNVDLLVTNIVDPSASIRGEYTNFNISLKDGMRLSGIIFDPTPESFQVTDSQGERVLVSRADVAEIREASISLMPEGLLDDLDRQGLTDFFYYLTSTGP